MIQLKELRKHAGLTQGRLGDIIGVKQSTVSSWEVGASTPPVGMLIKLANLFDCTIDRLCGREPPGSDQVS